MCANCGDSRNVFCRGCPIYKFKCEVPTLRYKIGFALREDRQEPGFSLTPYSSAALHSAPPPSYKDVSTPTPFPSLLYRYQTISIFHPIFSYHTPPPPNSSSAPEISISSSPPHKKTFFSQIFPIKSISETLRHSKLSKHDVKRET